MWDGIEITFTDEEGNGSCDFAPVPAGEGLPAALRSVLTQWSPSSIARSAAEERPICDPLEDLEDPLGFFHSLAAFKALEGGSTALEVYVSVPMNMGRHVRKERRTHLEVGESLALLDEETGAVHRQQSHLSYSGAGNLTQNTADRATDVLRLELRPGSYTLDLKVEDPALKRVSRIRKRIELPDYGAPGLACSDLNLGRLSQGSDQDPGFRKGGVDIIPDPTMVFNASESIVAYFEVYNLARNTVGQTHYRVAMSVTPQDSPGETSAIAGLTRYHGGDGRPSDTTFETRGPDAYGRECSELRITAGVTGPQILSIAITDLNNGHTVTKTASFTLVD